MVVDRFRLLIKTQKDFVKKLNGYKQPSPESLVLKID